MVLNTGKPCDLAGYGVGQSGGRSTRHPAAGWLGSQVTRTEPTQRVRQDAKENEEGLTRERIAQAGAI